MRKQNEKISKKETTSLHRGSIFRKILLIFVLLSIVPVAFSAFLIVSTYQSVLLDLAKQGVLTPLELGQLKENILIQILLILFLLIILVIFASILVAKSITRPILVLVEGVKEVAQGNLNIRFRIKSKDELGGLAAAFNQMIIKLREQRERERLVARLKTEFISIAAHQLRTPLSTIKWILKMLLDEDFGPIGEKQREFVEKGYAANERMINLVNDLLNVSRIEEGKFGFQFGNHDFYQFLLEVVDSFEQKAKIQNVDLIYHFKKEPLILYFDPQRLRMAVSNLLDNAIRYTPPGGKVSLFVFERPEVVEVIVKDSGVGIPAEQQSRIFTKFFRGDNVVKMQTEGTGLGLYLAKNIIERHKGKIWFESQEGKGTTFHFTIPRKQI